MTKDLKQVVSELLFQDIMPPGWTWTSQYRKKIIADCCDIMEQCLQEDFTAHSATYCQKVAETCDALIKGVNAEKEENTEEWPHNQTLFDSEDYVSSFVNCLFRKAKAFAPIDGSLDKLGRFIDREAPCCYHCTGRCQYWHILHCYRNKDNA